MKISFLSTSLIVFAALLFFLSCSNDTPVSSRFDLVGDNEVGEILQAETIPQIDSTAGKNVNTGLGPLLQLGLFNDARSQFLIRFNALPAGVTVRSAELVLPTHLAYGDGPDFEATAHRIVSDWQDTTVTFENFNNAFDPLVVGSQNIAAVDTDSVVIALDNALVTGWINQSISNYGVLVQAPTATFAKAFNSRNSALAQPILRLAYTNNSIDSTKNISVSSDAFIFEVLQPLPLGPLYVTHGTGNNSLVKFDLTSFPAEATINRAQVVFTVDLTNTQITTDQMTVLLLAVGKNSVDPIAAISDSAFQLGAMFVGDSTATLTFEVRSMVQSWLRPVGDVNHLDNYGLVLKAQYPDNDLQQLVIHSRESNPALAPKLKIDYTLPPRIQ